MAPAKIGNDLRNVPTTPAKIGNDLRNVSEAPAEIGNDHRKRSTAPAKNGSDRRNDSLAPAQMGNGHRNVSKALAKMSGRFRNVSADDFDPSALLRLEKTDSLTAMNFASSKTGWKLLAACLIAVGLSGCFQAANKFYLESDIVTDKRLEGRFGGQATNQDSASEWLVVKLGAEKHYVATFHEREHWIELDAVLFKSGTNLFVDISHRADNGAAHKADGGPSGVGMLLLATRDKSHSAFRVQFVEDAIEFQFALGAPLGRALNKDRSLKLKLIDEHSAIILDPTEKLRSFLAKVANDDSTFPQKARWIRVK